MIEYRDIKGFPGYRVGNDGSIWTLWVKGTRWKDRHLGTQWRYLPGHVRGSSGHLAVTLINGFIKQEEYIHKLVLNAFVGECPYGLEACHDDGNERNNAATNLRWDTRLSNHHDRYLHGVNKIGPIEAQDIRTSSLTGKELALKYNTSESNISCIRNYQTHKDKS